MLFAVMILSVKNEYRTDRRLSGIALIKNNISAKDAQSEAESI